jgi:hypothetical protein
MRAQGAVRRRRRRRNKQRESDLPPQLVFDGRAQPIEVPIEDRPHQTVLPVWEWPGITQGISPSRNYEQIKAVLYWDIRLTLGEALVMATALRKATIRNEMAIIRKITSLIAVP